MIIEATNRGLTRIEEENKSVCLEPRTFFTRAGFHENPPELICGPS